MRNKPQNKRRKLHIIKLHEEKLSNYSENLTLLPIRVESEKIVTCASDILVFTKCVQKVTFHFTFTFTFLLLLFHFTFSLLNPNIIMRTKK
jgi:hypothetical protein